MSRYDATGAESEHQPTGEEGVLRNRLALTRKRDIDDAETELLDALYQSVPERPREALTFDDILTWHRQWLGNLYSWAGTLRTVNMSKGGFPTARLPTLGRP